MAFSSTLDTSLEAKIKKSGELDADIVDKLSTTASDALSARNSTIQLLRDGFYRACEAYAGGALSGPEYGAIVGQYQHVMLALLSIELLTDINQPKRRPLVLNVDGQAGSTAETPQSNGEENPDPQQSAPSVQENGPSSDNEITWDSLIDAAQAESQGYSRGLSDTSIEVIAATAVRLVERVLRNESARMLQPRLAECMRPTELEGQQAENREKWCDIIVLNIGDYIRDYPSPAESTGCAGSAPRSFLKSHSSFRRPLHDRPRDVLWRIGNGLNLRIRFRHCFLPCQAASCSLTRRYSMPRSPFTRLQCPQSNWRLSR